MRDIISFSGDGFDLIFDVSLIWILTININISVDFEERLNKDLEKKKKKILFKFILVRGNVIAYILLDCAFIDCLRFQLNANLRLKIIIKIKKYDNNIPMIIIFNDQCVIYLTNNNQLNESEISNQWALIRNVTLSTTEC